MTRSVRKMPTPLGVGAGQTATVQLPLGLTYERLMIVMRFGTGTGTAVPVASWGTYIDDIRLIVDGDTRIEIRAADLVKLNQFHGQEMVAGVLPLFLSQPWRRTIGGEDSTAYGTNGGMSSFTLEMDVKAGVVVNSLEVYAMQSPGRAFGPHLRIQRHVLNQGVTGEAQIADIPRGNWALTGLHFDTDEIEDVEILVDNRIVQDTNKLVRNAQAVVTGKATQAGMTHIDFTTQNRVADALPMMVQDFRVKADFTATGNFSIYAETIRAA